MRLSLALLLPLLLLTACRRAQEPSADTPSEPKEEIAEAQEPPARVGVLAGQDQGECGCKVDDWVPGKGLPFIEDDYERAAATSNERLVPLFVDAWAPWCHSCLSMKRTVFTDPRLEPFARDFVWLSLNTEKEENAAFLEKHPQKVWPTLMILEPETERPLLRHLGAPTVEELIALLENAQRVVGRKAEGPDALLAEADAHHAAGAFDEAVAKYGAVLAEAKGDWPQRSRAVLGLLTAQRYGGGDMGACARTALRELPRLQRSATRAKVASLGLRCAVDQGEAEAIATLEAEVRSALEPPAIEMGGDDRSNLYELLVTVRRRRGDAEGAKAIAAEWIAFLEKEAIQAPSAEIRAIYDSHRLLASLLLDTPERVVEALRASEKADPEDYNPPARLAVVLHRLGRLDEALAASDRALEKVYGPRKARVLNERGAILADKGERALARAAHASVLAWAEGLPAGQRPQREIERARAALAALGGESAASR